MPGVIEISTAHVIRSSVRKADAIPLFRASSLYFSRVGLRPGPVCLLKVQRQFGVEKAPAGEKPYSLTADSLDFFRNPEGREHKTTEDQRFRETKLFLRGFLPSRRLWRRSCSPKASPRAMRCFRILAYAPSLLSLAQYNFKFGSYS